MDNSWQGGFSQQQLSAFNSQLDAGQSNEDWEAWLRWDPAGEASSPGDGTFNSASSKNDSPLQDPLFASFHQTNDEPLNPPLIVGDDDLAFGAGNGMANEPFLFGDIGDIGNGFIFDQSTDIHNIQSIPKLDTNTAAWPLLSHDGPDTSLDLSALIDDQPQQPISALTATTPSLHHSPESTSRQRTSIASTTSPAPVPAPAKKKGGRKRKAETQLQPQPETSPQNAEGGSGEEEGEDGPIKKTSHNVIEKRYRNNLNDKIVELRNAVPALRAVGRNGEEVENLEGLTPAHKLNKATVMAKATEYIRHLEKRNKTMSDEMDILKAQLAKVEATIGKTKDRQASFSMSSASSPTSSSSRSREASSASQAGTPSFLNVPQDQQSRFGQAVVQQQYMQQQSQPSYARAPNPPVDAQNQPHVVKRRGGFMNKVMLGTMAGVMAMEGFTEHQASSDRSMAALPTALFKRGTGASPSLAAGLSRQAMIPLLKMLLVVGALVYLLTPLLTFSSRRKQKMRAATQLPKAPSLASPVEVRRKAWDTAIQSVWVPKHFLVEVVAVGLKMLSLSVRRLIGSEAFTNITGTSKEEEAARIKAWDIAIDAQLAGGDARVSYYRLLLTLMESGTLPDSPARLAQKAVHFRVFFWEVANAGYGNMIGFKQFTEKVGKYYWDSARRLQKELVHAKLQGRPGDEDEVETLPDHLAQLVKLDCDEVLSDEMIQRAWNLAWNKPSAHALVPNAARDSVVEDHAIRSPLDAVAAWYTNTVIDDTLADALSDTNSTIDTEYHVGLALSVAPPASSTHVRALTAKAVLSNTKREANIIVALEALPVISPTGGMNLVNHAPASPDVCTALTLAKLISLSSPQSSQAARERAYTALRGVQPAPGEFTPLTVIATYRLLRSLSGRKDLSRNAERGLEELAGNLRVWVGTSGGRDSGLGNEGRTKLVKLCLHIAKQLGGWDEGDERDSGYGSAVQSQSSSPARAVASPSMVVT
ncbi:Sterol regulatory element-binding protein 1 [Fulvia fulva]|uniref:Sterol regulatory element-binding protein 1 n=1 Tax=Passalora fulva TaxID=5499 RepID=A0A9Q8P415_PASFU|nr:Sterol regulatory element-binding protein 1 [Fulvia fulva]KAK4634889.1 Sterol regulatory element-binding protein 1 [Fulvia fulva]KAK4637484.1 Sterol regulatory element-binding protein 1 [Fulvia fulva]UJO12389.1 Sterol regulatory element-binding protein 1 [Fulvia fulva]WPV10151.1 Sterol regulatory element-binding protein 1 [Fulvia fulva]WPV25318.1 Sterol regulatory element-binding protein 1 [Fulvia fulva]